MIFSTNGEWPAAVVDFGQKTRTRWKIDLGAMIATSLQNRGYPKPKTQKIKSIFDEAKKSGKEGFLNFFIFQNPVRFQKYF